MRAKTKRAPRTSRTLLARINKRAFSLSTEAYARYRDELLAAILEAAVSANEIESWQPHIAG